MLLQKEEKERERQILAIREYNQRKRNVYNARLGKFLKLYPYADKTNRSMDRFYRSVKSADQKRLNDLIESFNEENQYWNTYYVLQNCNNDVYNHIINVLTFMHDSLTDKIQQVDLDTHGESDNGDESNSINGWGKQGEKEVDYVLKWLSNEYIVVEKDCTSKYGGECILLKNGRFIDEAQEYDHIVVGPQGIFLIETKNYSGKLYIDNDGNWLRMKKGESEWMPETNPTQQINRHHVLLESIVGKDVPIIDIVCLAHPDIMVAGQDNSKVTVVKKDLLGDYIMNYPGNTYSEDEIEGLVYQINIFKVSK